MKVWGAIGWFSAAAFAALLSASPAVAHPGYRVVQRSGMESLETSGSHSFRVIVLSTGGQSTLIAIRGNSTVSYSVTAHFEPGRIVARFGSRGTIDVRFHPHGHPEVEDVPGCRGTPPTTENGSFVGTIRFRGEQGFTSLRKAHAVGQVERPFRLVCKRGRKKLASSAWHRAVSLRAESHSVKRTVRLIADKAEGEARKPTVNYTAQLLERRPQMKIIRQVFRFAYGDSLAVTRPGEVPVLATATPGGLFVGDATFERDTSGKVTWTGDLSAPFPGRGRVRLTGPSFNARLCRNSSCACNRRTPCLGIEEVPAQRLQARQGSGSHSQPFGDTRLSWSR